VFFSLLVDQPSWRGCYSCVLGLMVLTAVGIQRGNVETAGGVLEENTGSRQVGCDR